MDKYTTDQKSEGSRSSSLSPEKLHTEKIVALT
jgi:hypothetical protein